MHRVWGYARSSLTPEFMSVDEQRKAINEYTQGLDAEFLGVTVDSLDGAHKFMFLDRPNAHALNESMQRGDHIVFAAMDRGFWTLRDFMHCYEMWHARGIMVHVLDFLDVPIDTIRRFVEFERLATTERNKEKSTYEYHRKPRALHPPAYGWKTVGRKGHKKFVPDLEQRALLEEIVTLTDQGWAVLDIEALLADRGERYKHKGRWKSWTAVKIRRAYKAGVKLREASGQCNSLSDQPPPQDPSSQATDR